MLPNAAPFRPAATTPLAGTVLDSAGPPMSDRYTQDDLADPERRAAVTEALAGRRFSLTVREVSPEHGTGWGMAAEFPDGVWFELSALDHDHPAQAGARLGEALVEVREIENRWRFAAADLVPAEPSPGEPAAATAEAEPPEPAPESVESPAPEAAPDAAPAGPEEKKEARPADKPAPPRIVRGDELLRRVLQLLVRRAREGRRAPSPKLKAAVADGRSLGLDLAILERWLPSPEQAIQMEGRVRRWLEAALDKHATPERADARESLQCLLETFDRAGQPLANLARRAFADRERRPAPPPGPRPERAERPERQRPPRRPRHGRAKAAPGGEATAAGPTVEAPPAEAAPAENAAGEPAPPPPAEAAAAASEAAPAGD